MQLAAHSLRRLTALIALTCALAAPRIARGEDAPQDEVQRAEALADEAFAAYSKGDYEAAVNLYLKAYEVAPGPDIVYNVARVYDTRLKDKELAAQFYRRYIADPGADPERVRVANERLTSMRELPRAAPVGPEPSAPPQPIAPKPAPKAEPEQLPRKLSGLSRTGLSLLAVGVAGLGVGAGFGGAAMVDAKVAKEECDGNACRSPRGLRAAEDGGRFAEIATVAFAAGGGLALVGTALLIWGVKRTRRADKSSLSLAPALTRQGAMATITGRW